MCAMPPRVSLGLLGAALAVAVALAACAPDAPQGPRVALDLRVRGGHPGYYVARVLRSDGVVVAEYAGSADRDGPGDRLRVILACDPSLDAQPNRLELRFDPPAGVPDLVLPPLPLTVPFACDAVTVPLAHELLLAATPPGALVLGDARCTTTFAAAPPEYGGPSRVSGALRCDGPARVQLDLDVPRLDCGDLSRPLPVATPAPEHLIAALPWADAVVRPSAAARAVDLALEPLLGRDCALTLTFRVREQDTAGTRPTVTWRVDASAGTATLAYADPPPALATEDSPEPIDASATWDGATLTLALPLPASLAHPRFPSGGVLLAATTDDGAHAWLIHVTAREVVALRDDVPTPLVGRLTPDGVVEVALPAGPGAFVVAPLSHADGPLGRARVLSATLVTPGPVADLAVDADAAHPLVGLPAHPAAGTPVLLRGAFPAPATVRVGAVTPTTTATSTALAFTWPAEPVADPSVALEARWAPLAPGLCATLGLCLPAVATPHAARHLAPPLPSAVGPVDDALVARLLDGDPRLGVAPVLVGATRVVAFATGRATCLAARAAPGDPVAALLVGTAEGDAHRFTTVTAAGDRWGCADGALTDAALALATGTPAAYGAHGLDLLTSPAGVVFAVPTDAPRLVAVTPVGDHLEVVVTGFPDPGPGLTLHLGADDLALASQADGSWRAALPSAARSALARVTDAAGAATPHVWVTLAGGDSDGDGLDDGVDVCPRVADPTQGDGDDDGVGDACDPDADGDGWAEVIDRCPGEPDEGQEDADGDGAGDACDAFPGDPDEQWDADQDGIGDNYQAALCGNGVVDAEAHETCDDGNAVPRDGCEPNCRLPCGADVDAVLAVRDDRTGHCFFSLPGKVDFDQATARCEAAGGYLAIPDDGAENYAAYQVTRFQPDGGWLGIDDRVEEGVFRTLAGGALAFTAWGNAEPTSGPWLQGTPVLPEIEDCVAMLRASATWKDADCGDPRGVVCEAAAAPCGDGVPAPTLGEECDDGNLDPGDGCEPDCTLGCRVRDHSLAADAPPPPNGVPPGVLLALRDPKTGHCLVAVENGTWVEAAARCGELGGYLWVPDDEREDAFGAALLPYGGYLGVHDGVVERDWRTVQGGPAPFTAWAPDDGDRLEESCAYRRGDGLWYDLYCRAPEPYVCEITDEPCGDGVIEPALGETCDAGDGSLGIVCGDDCTSDFELPPGAWAGVRLAKDDHRLVAFAGTVSDRDAEALCEAVGGYPAVPDDLAEAAILVVLGGGWIGLNLEGPAAQLWTPQRGRSFYASDKLPPMTVWGGRGPRAAITDALWWEVGPYYKEQQLLCEIEPVVCGDGVIQVALGEACDGADLGCGPDCTPACDVDAPLAARSPRTGRCIVALDAPQTAAEGVAARCAKVGAVPYAPLSADEDRIAADLNRRAWMGVGDAAKEGDYVDASGAPVGFAFWDELQPSDLGVSGEDCVEMLPRGGWDDAVCGVPLDHVLCGLAPPACGDGNQDLGEACDDGNLVNGDGCDCPPACAPELATRATFAEVGGRCLWATSAALAAADAEASCEAAGGALMAVDDRWRRALAGRLGGGWVGGECVRADAAGGLEESCVGAAPALCERAPEHCGDGVVQEALGETCDDGNRAGLGGDGAEDGCGADCTLPCGPLGAEVAFVDPAQGACFFRLPGVVTWAEAADRCGALGAHLAFPAYASEQATLARLGVAWVGVRKADVNSPFMTVLGDPPPVAPWARGQPDDWNGAEQCVAIYRAFGGRWDDVACDLLFPVVCETP